MTTNLKDLGCSAHFTDELTRLGEGRDLSMVTWGTRDKAGREQGVPDILVPGIVLHPPLLTVPALLQETVRVISSPEPCCAVGIHTRFSYPCPLSLS